MIRRRKMRSSIPTELTEQIKLCVWMTKHDIDHYAIPNGGRRNLVEGANLKRSGMQKGFPDLGIPIPTKSYPGLYLEVKRVEDGVISEEQHYWIDKLRKRGYRVEVCYGAEEGKAYIRDYLGLVLV